MTIQNYSAAEYIAAQSERIDQLTAEVQELRQQNAILTAINLRLSATDLSAADIAESLRQGCPQWREVAAILVPPCQCWAKELPPALAALQDHLTKTENRILRFLYEHLDKTVVTETVIHAAGMRCADNMERAHQSLHVHINRLRKKLDKWKSPLRVYTVKGVGYRLEEVTE